MNKSTPLPVLTSNTQQGVALGQRATTTATAGATSRGRRGGRQVPGAGAV